MHLDSILDLPDELIINTLKYTDYKTVIACRRSCHHLKEIVDASSVLQYIVELAAAGMCDGTPDGAVPAERLRRLRGMQDAWKSSPWSSVDDFPYSKGISPYPMIASGNLVVFRNSRGPRGKLVLLRFPSESRGIPGMQWYLDVGTNRLEASCADDSQDLLVFACTLSLVSFSTFHIRTLSTGDVHPLTSTTGCIDSYPMFGGIKLHIYGDILLILGNTPIIGLVWNWKTGELVAKIPLTTSCCSFLDKNHIISVNLNLDHTISFQVAALPDIAGARPSCVYRFMLNLPIVIPPYFAELHANTLPTGGCESPSSDRAAAGWFHADPSSRLLCLALGLPTGDGQSAAFTQRTLFVQHDVFLSYIASHGPSPSSSRASSASSASSADSTRAVSGRMPVVVVPWDAWGPGNMRMTTTPHVFQRNTGQHKVCGMHALGLPHILRFRGILRITDFHPYRVARAAQGDDGDDDGGGGGHGDDGQDEEHEEHDGQDEEYEEHDGDDDDDDADELEGRWRARKRPDFASGVVPRSTEIPYVEKDIPLPDGLRSEHVRCVLGEDLVFLFEFSVGGPENPGYRVEKIYYHPI